MLVIGTTVAFIASVRTPALGSRPELAEASDDGEADAGGDLEKANALCGNCYKMNLCSKLALGNYSDEKQACLCDGVGPDAQKACQVQCAQSGPEPVGEIKLMPCGKSACNRCSRNCGGGNYWANPGTIANWKYSPTFTSGKTWSRVSSRASPSRRTQSRACAKGAPSAPHPSMPSAGILRVLAIELLPGVPGYKHVFARVQLRLASGVVSRIARCSSRNRLANKGQSPSGEALAAI